MTEIIEKSTGLPYWYEKSDFCGGCWHIFASANYDAWVFNLFNETEFMEIFTAKEEE